MPTFDSAGVPIHYTDEGSGPPVVLAHGFAADADRNWRAPGVIAALLAAGRRVIAFDARGHGASGKPHDPEAYDRDAMAGDVVRLMDHLGIERADLAGYSMGGFTSASLLAKHPERFNSVVLAGVGDSVIEPGQASMRGRSRHIAEAMRASAGARHDDETARGFRVFAEALGNDLQALAAVVSAPDRAMFDPAVLAGNTLPVLVLVGDADALIGPSDGLAAAVRGAKHVVVPGDHLSAVGQAAFRQAIVDFLAECSPAGG